jgi:hypothetical protein
MSSMARHHELCRIAARWLSGTMRCNVVLAGVASCREIPDAIGWSTSWKHHGSIVVECKNSMSDFHRDRRKKHAKRMGDWRYFLCPNGVISPKALAEYFPDHGLLYARGSRVSIIVPPQDRGSLGVEHASEVRMLQFALLHMQRNLLWAGLTVDMRELTKHPMIADRSGLLDGFVKAEAEEEAWLG